MEETADSPRGPRLRVTLGAGIVLVLLAAAVAVLVSAFSARGVTSTASTPGASGSSVVHTTAPSANRTPSAFVHVVGAVHDPGLYELAAGSRVVDAVAAAGGFTPSADQSTLNLAQVVTDGEQVVVTRRGASPTADAGVGAAGGSVTGAKVDINTADATALQTLDGIGPALAQRILDYRTTHGRFASVSGLQNVSGIGDKKFAAIKDHVTA